MGLAALIAALIAALMAGPVADAVALYEGGALAVKDVEREFKIPRSTLYELMSSGRLPYSQIGRKRFIARRAIAELMAQNTVGLPKAP